MHEEAAPRDLEALMAGRTGPLRSWLSAVVEVSRRLCASMGERRCWLPALVAAAGIVLSFAAFQFASAWQHESDDIRFMAAAEQRIGDARERTAQRLAAVEAMAGFMMAAHLHESAEARSQFHRMAEEIFEGTGDVGELAWIPAVTASERESFEEAARASGIPTFEVREVGPAGFGPAGSRDVYYPILFNEPAPLNPLAFGMDLGAFPAVRSLLETARDTGSIVVSDALVVGATTLEGPSIAAFHPVYSGDDDPETVEARRATLLGFVSGTFRVADLIGAGRATPARATVRLRVDDLSAPPGARVLFAESEWQPGAPAMSSPAKFDDPGLTATISLGRREWLISVIRGPGYVGVAGWPSWLVLGAGLAISALASLFLAREMSNHARSISRVVRDGEQRLRSVVDGMAEGLVLFDASTRILFLNDQAARLYGVERSEATGKTATKRGVGVEFLTAAAERAVYAELPTVRAFREGRPQRDQRLAIKRADGTVVQVRSNSAPLFSPGADRPDRVMVTYSDVTAQVEAEALVEQRTAELRETAEQLDQVLDYAAEAIIIMDGDGRITTFNRAAEVMFGFEAQEVIGRPPGMLMPSPHSERHPDYVRHYVETGQPTGEATVFGGVNRVQARRRDGTEFPVELSVSETMTAKGLVFTGIVRDVTEELAATERLNDLNRRLQTALEEAEAARAEAEEATDAKSQFLASMSHEIRTPMVGVMGMTSLLLDTDLDSEQREWAETVRTSAEALLAIINNILDFSKVEGGKIELEESPFDMEELIADSLDLVMGAATAGGLSLVTRFDQGCPRRFVGDAGRIRQMLLNLLSNAVKFTRQGYVLTEVQAVRANATQSTVRISVTDTGIGIPADKLDAVFEEFSQADASTTREYGGTGLGLAITRRLAELMGGSVDVVSAEGEGTTFVLELPLPHAPAEDEAALTAMPRDARVLIVNGLEISRTIVADYIASWGMRSTTVASGDEAATALRDAAAQGAPYDIVIVQQDRSRPDDLALARRIRSADAAGVAPLILHGPPRQEPNTEGLEPVAYVREPLRASTLFDAITDLLDACGRRNGAGPADATSTQTRAVDAGPSEPRGSQSPGSQPRGRVLVAEDNAVNQRVAVSMIEKLGYRADAVANGREAIAALARIRYDAVLMDCQMPEMDGYEATRAIRRERWGENLPVIAMTANAMQGDRERCLAAGMDDYMAKPVQMQELASSLRRWVSANRSDGQRPPEGEAAPPPSSESVVDWARLEEVGLIGADADGESLADTFAESTGGRFRAMRAAIQSGDAKALRLAAHSLKGSAANLGARHLTPLAAELEELGRDGALDGAERLTRRALIERDRVLDALRSRETADEQRPR